MRHKKSSWMRRFGAFLLAVMLVLQMPVTVAAEVSAGQIVYINNADDLLEFVDNCSFDIWSQGKTVMLENDISLEDMEVLPVPTFGGTFDGQGHTISGLTIETGLSRTGFFSVVQEGAVVRNLNVAGTWLEESNDCVGGIAGVNYGVIEDCTFSGIIKGSANVGGIAGENGMTGKIRDCAADGSIAGKSRTGGIVGNNLGLVSSSESRCGVNVESVDPGLNLEKMDIELNENLLTIGNLDVINVATDTGGIAGYSSGMIINCVNMGAVGYPQIGYNVGGITGRNSGYLTACDNHGEIFGRKDVGGITGQAEPFIELTLSEELFQDFHDELDVLSRMVDEAVSEAQASSRQVSETLNNMGKTIDSAADTAKTLTDSLQDFAEDTVDEINRGADIVSDVVSMLEDSLYFTDKISESVTDGLEELEDAMDNFSDASDLGADAVAQVKKTVNDVVQAGEHVKNMAGQVRSSIAALKESVTQMDWAAAGESLKMFRASVVGLGNAVTTLGAEISDLQDVLAVLQKLEPAGRELAGGFSDLSDAMDWFADASDDMTDLFSDLYDIIEYLDDTESLKIGTEDDMKDQTDQLYEQMKEAGDYAENLESQVSGMTDDLADRIRGINSQLTKTFDTLTDTLYQAKEDENALFSDTSQEDIDRVMDGKIRGCENYGAVSGSTGVGGVAGTMSIEYELDPEDDLFSDHSLLRRREYELKAILQNCVNEGAVTARGDYVGSICGDMRLGLIIGCEGYGDIESENGDYVGGIVGRAQGTVRESCAKCMLGGRKNIGGIVGSAAPQGMNSDGGLVTGCYSLAQITDFEKHGGAVAGEEGGTFENNYFVAENLAGIDRISVAGEAEPITYEEMIAVPEIPNKFRWFYLRFYAEDCMLKSMLFDYGTTFDGSVYPEVPEKEGYYYSWNRTELENLCFDTDVTAEYVPYLWSLASEQRREDGRPVIFVEGRFENDAAAEVMAVAVASDAVASVETLSTEGTPAGMMTAAAAPWESANLLEKRELLEIWDVAVPEDGGETRNVRYLPPEEFFAAGGSADGRMEKLEVYQYIDGQWKLLETSEMGSYTVSEMSGSSGELAFVMVTVRWWIAVLGGALALAAAGAAMVYCWKKRRAA